MTIVDLDKPILDFSRKDKADFSWTIRDAVEGVQIFGGIGSGKTSGSGKMLAHKYLGNGFGGLVLTVKQEEKDLWLQYCKQTGRQQDLIIVEPGGGASFNFLEYESSATESGKSITANIVQVLKTVIRASEEKNGGKSDDPFWEVALDMLMFNVINLCLIAYEKISVDLLYNVTQSLPKKAAQPVPGEVKSDKPKTPFEIAFELAREKVMARIKAWEAGLSEQRKQQFRDNPALQDKAIDDEVPDARILQHAGMFLQTTFRNLNEKTRSIVDFSFAGFLFRLLQDPVYSLFCNHPSGFTPEDCLRGKIILINLPVKIYYKAGQDCQIMFKYIWQRAMEKRKVDAHSLPVFLWADEAQNFLHEYDADYQATARSSRIATVYISQNINNYLANMGGDKYENKVKSFLGTLGTKIFHANADLETNKYASELFGEGYQKKESEATSTTDGKSNVTKTITSELARVVRPEEFAQLMTGGPLNNYKVSGYIHIQGKTNASGFNHQKTIFPQMLPQ